MPSSRISGAEPLFLDTSVLVRLYYLEPEDPFEWAVDLAQRPGTLLAASHLAYVETLAAFHALRRGRAITSRRQAFLSAAFRADWPAFLRVPLSPGQVERTLVHSGPPPGWGPRLSLHPSHDPPKRMGLRGERSLGTSRPRRGRKVPTLRTLQGLTPGEFLPSVTSLWLPDEP